MTEKLWETQHIEKIDSEKKVNEKLNKLEEKFENINKENQVFNILGKIQEENPDKKIILETSKDNKLYLIIDWDKNPVWLSKEQFINKFWSPTDSPEIMEAISWYQPTAWDLNEAAMPPTLDWTGVIQDPWFQ